MIALSIDMVARVVSLIIIVVHDLLSLLLSDYVIMTLVAIIEPSPKRVHNIVWGEIILAEVLI